MSIKLQPATIENDLRSRINKLLESARFYLNEQDAEIQEVLHAAKNLRKADPAAGFAAEARIFHLCGNIDQAHDRIGKAEQYGFNRDVLADKCAIFANLGFFREAQPLFKVCADPRAGTFARYGDVGLACGAIHQHAAFFADAEKMGLEYDAQLAASVTDASGILKRCGVSDQQLGEALNLLGSIMRKMRMFFLGVGPDLFAWKKNDTDQFVHLSYKFPLLGPEVEKLDTQLVESLFDAQDALPDNVSITMKSGLSLDERLSGRPASGSGKTSPSRI